MDYGEEDMDYDELVQDPEADIAHNEYLDGIRVSVAGRVRFQKIYVRALNGKKSTTTFNPEDDAPPRDRTLSILPTTEEKEGRPNTTQFLVVGLVLASDPFKYSTKFSGKSRNKEKERARKSRGVLSVEANVLRAMVPVTEDISRASIKYYVACHPVMNLCSMRVITRDAIFFFSEIWTGISTKVDIKQRRTAIGSACKRHAATIKPPPERVRIAIIKSTDLTASNTLAVTREANAANVLLMQYSLWELTKDPKALEALEKTAKNILPDLANRPSSEGTLAFYNFESALEKADAKNLIKDVKVSYPNICSLDADLIVKLHAAIRKVDIGHDLPYQSLTLFLELAHDRSTARWEVERLELVVLKILHDIKIVNKIPFVYPVSTVSEEQDKSQALVPFITSVRQALCEIKDFLSAQATALRDQHGGVQRHLSIEDLMVKIGNCVDKTALMALEEQVFAIHAEQLATGNSQGAGYISELVGFIDAALGRKQGSVAVSKE
ncbi:hypothetical protein K505DRAFT_230468 [Melanomma pulvis-pyrius CBS 109.77]|uniref:Uncharacterized protein n=1 Tax=Melanomma pulvis-pyrius CBS 109.77 TaxID=1314802 RepID=A0A6A6XT65_9PLEO|nr:hypothetical protein K505DRAFT_230468 [Melanomma pulvis-pyrius CBS 109.77]